MYKIVSVKPEDLHFQYVFKALPPDLGQTGLHHTDSSSGEAEKEKRKSVEEMGMSGGIVFRDGVFNTAFFPVQFHGRGQLNKCARKKQR